MTPRRRLRACRGGGRVVRSGDALCCCVALVPVPSHIGSSTLGDASVPTPHPSHPRPYGTKALLSSFQKTYPGERSVFCGAKRSSASDASLLTASCSFRRAILEGGDGGAAWAGDVLPDSTGCS